MNLGASREKDIAKRHSDSKMEDAAEDILRHYKDQGFSYTDAVSFALMKHYKIDHAFSFDRHFTTVGFTLIP